MWISRSDASDIDNIDIDIDIDSYYDSNGDNNGENGDDNGCNYDDGDGKMMQMIVIKSDTDSYYYIDDIDGDR